MKYVIVSPVRDEEKLIRFTLDSVINQTTLPGQWIIVDDGSSDRTASIVWEYAEKYPWITLVELPDRGYRMPGEGVVRAFNAGLEKVQIDLYDFIIKLDGDLSFGPSYFDRLLSRFGANPKLGIAGGALHVPRGTRWVLERAPEDHVRGATKVYRRECFQDIGGLETIGGWDAIDELRAQMQGWETLSFSDLHIRQYRPTGTAESKVARMVKSGEFSYLRGYHPAVVLLRGAFRAFTDQPFMVGGAAMLWGYLRSWLTRQRRLDDPELIAYSRRKSLSRLAFWRRIGAGRGLQ